MEIALNPWFDFDKNRLRMLGTLHAVQNPLSTQAVYSVLRYGSIT